MHFRPANVMQTFLKMSSVVYSMAGLGSVEESKVYRDRFASDDKDSLKDEANLTTGKGEAVSSEIFVVPPTQPFPFLERI